MSTKNSITDVHCVFTKDGLTTFLVNLQDLAKINKDHTVKVIFDHDKTLMYTLNGATIFKTCQLDNKDLFSSFPDEFKEQISMMVLDADKFVKRMAFYRDSEEVKATLGFRKNYSGQNYVYYFKANDKKLKMSIVCGEQNKLDVITRTQIQSKVDAPSDFVFNIDIEKLQKIKKLSALYPDDTTLTIRIKSNKLFFEEEDKWSMHVDDVESENASYRFTKKYINSINNSNSVKIEMKGLFMTISNETVLLMIGLEVSDF